MSKQIDPNKIDRIRESAITLISRYGENNTSVAAIAAEAGVSAGYLYRHYSGKSELVNDLLVMILRRFGDFIAGLIEDGKPLESMVSEFIAFLFDTAERRPDHIRFCLNLQNDLAMEILPEATGRLKMLCGDIRRRGVEKNYLGEEITTEDLYVILICLPLQYIGVRLRNIFVSFRNDPEDIGRIARICLAAINKNRSKE